MVGQMTYGKRQFEALDPMMRKLIPPFHSAMNQFYKMVDEDANAFNAYMAALKMPKNTEEERMRRQQQMQSGLQEAVKVPLLLAQRVSGLWSPLKELCLHGNAACLSDAQVAAKALETSVFGAYFNVIINLKDVTDTEFKLKTEREAKALLQEAQDCASVCLCACEQRTSQN
ncbi:unnamed protein product [Knipowitschia caucasica]